MISQPSFVAKTIHFNLAISTPNGKDNGPHVELALLCKGVHNEMKGFFVNR